MRMDSGRDVNECTVSNMRTGDLIAFACVL